MSLYEKTFDNILNGRISIIQYKNGFRFGFDSVFLASFVNGFLENKKSRKISIADIGAGVGAVSLIIAFRNPNSEILAIDNNSNYLKIADENIKNNNYQDRIKTIHADIFNPCDKLIDSFDLVVSNPPFHKIGNNKSQNILKDIAKRIVNFEKWIENSVKLLKNKGILFLIIPTDILDQAITILAKKTGSLKIFPLWPNNKKFSKRVIIIAKKGGNSPTELMRGLVLYNNLGKITKKAKISSEDGVFKFL